MAEDRPSFRRSDAVENLDELRYAPEVQKVRAMLTSDEAKWGKLEEIATSKNWSTKNLEAFSLERMTVLITYYGKVGAHVGPLSSIKENKEHNDFKKVTDRIVDYIYGDPDAKAPKKILNKMRDAFRDNSRHQNKVFADIAKFAVKKTLSAFSNGGSEVAANALDAIGKVEKVAKIPFVKTIGKKVFNTFADVLPIDLMKDVKNFNTLINKYYHENYIPMSGTDGDITYSSSGHLPRVYFFPDLNSIISNANKFIKLSIMQVPVVFRLHRADIEFLQAESPTTAINTDVSFGSVFTSKLKKGQKYALTIPVNNASIKKYGVRRTVASTQHAIYGFKLRYMSKKVDPSLREIGFRAAKAATKMIFDILGENWTGLAKTVYSEAKAAYQDLPDFSNLETMQFIHKSADRMSEYRKALPWALVRALVYTRQEERTLLTTGKTIPHVAREHAVEHNVHMDSLCVITPDMKAKLRQLKAQWRSFKGKVKRTFSRNETAADVIYDDSILTDDSDE